jgi:putative transcriptional regulator
VPKFETNLKSLRAGQNMTQDELARKVGVVRQTIAYIERGEYMPSLKLAHDIAALFGQPIEKIFNLK